MAKRANRSSSKKRVPRKRAQLSLSVLDLCKRSRTISASDSLGATLDLARLTEACGYTRFWIAEHHTDDAAQSSPEILLPLLAARTKSMRVGAGGILLQYQSPLKVAESFLALEALFPGRIDLGVCRGPGVTLPGTAQALVNGHDDDLTESAYEGKVSTLVNLLRAAPYAAVAPESIRVRPLGVKPPPVWLLGAGANSQRLAASFGTPYAYSLIFGGGLLYGPDLMAKYCQRFKPAPDRATAYGAVAASVICADSESRAKQCDAELVQQGCYQSNIVGTPGQCADGLKLFAELFGVDEIIVATFVQNPRERQRLYRRLAEEFHS